MATFVLQRIMPFGALLLFLGLVASVERLVAQIPPPGPAFCPAICWRIIEGPTGATDCPTTPLALGCGWGNPNCKSGIPEHDGPGGQCSTCSCTLAVGFGICQCMQGGVGGGGGGGGGGVGD